MRRSLPTSHVISHRLSRVRLLAGTKPAPRQNATKSGVIRAKRPGLNFARSCRPTPRAFDHEDASSRAVLETAKDEDAVQNYLAEQLRLRSKGRYHTARENEVAEGNM